MSRTPKAGINIFLAALLTVAAAYGQTVSPEPQNSPTRRILGIAARLNWKMRLLRIRGTKTKIKIRSPD